MKFEFFVHPVNMVLFKIVRFHERGSWVYYIIYIQGLIIDAVNLGIFGVDMNRRYSRIGHIHACPRLEYIMMLIIKA